MLKGFYAEKLFAWYYFTHSQSEAGHPQLTQRCLSLSCEQKHFVIRKGDCNISSHLQRATVAIKECLQNKNVIKMTEYK